MSETERERVDIEFNCDSERKTLNKTNLRWLKCANVKRIGLMPEHDKDITEEEDFACRKELEDTVKAKLLQGSDAY